MRDRRHACPSSLEVVQHGAVAFVDPVELAIPFNFEERVGPASFPFAQERIMQEAVHPRLADVAIGLEIPARVEGDVGFTAFLEPVEEEVLEGIDAGSRNVGIVIEII